MRKLKIPSGRRRKCINEQKKFDNNEGTKFSVNVP